MAKRKSMTRPSGEIWRELEGGQLITLVRVKGVTAHASRAGVTIENPSAEESQRTYVKIFRRREILLPCEEERAHSMLAVPNGLVIGATGFTSISQSNLNEWGLKDGAYENACAEILVRTITAAMEAYPQMTPVILDGAAPLGVDLSTQMAVTRLRLERFHLGVSCPQYLFYCHDDDRGPIFVAPDEDSYSDWFVRHLHILLAMGGRMRALLHDLKAAVFYDKRILLIPVLRAINTRGGVAARDSNGNIQDATIAFSECVHLKPNNAAPVSSDPYQALVAWSSEVVVGEARKLLPPACAYHNI